MRVPKQIKPKMAKNPYLMKYLRALIDPEFFYRTQNSVRVPDSFSRATATLSSFAEYSVTVNAAATTADGDLGRFCYVSNPSLASIGWIYDPGNAVAQYGRDSTLGALISANDTLTLGANLAYLDPTLKWDPARSLQTPPVLESNVVTNKMGKPFAPPIIPSYNSWSCEADPNAGTIGGTPVFNQIISANLQYKNGAAESIRPVAHCMWFQPSMASLANGGNVSIALLPPQALLGQVVPLNFVDASTETAQWMGQGPIVNWENLARVPGAFTGALKDGAYTYWVPSKISDIDMTSVAGNLIQNFPTIVCAGQWQGNTNSSEPFAGVIGTVRITTLYEYTTCDQSRATAKIDCVPGALDFVQCVLKNQPTSMENKTHRSWIDKVLATAAGIVAGGAAFFVSGPAGAVAVGTAAAGGVYAALKD